jgi:hypothetical protein
MTARNETAGQVTNQEKQPDRIPQVLGKYGGASRDRTDDLIVANDALSQLSYSPVRIVSEVPDYFISLRTRLPTFGRFRGL